MADIKSQGMFSLLQEAEVEYVADEDFEESDLSDFEVSTCCNIICSLRLFCQCVEKLRNDNYVSTFQNVAIRCYQYHIQ